MALIPWWINYPNVNDEIMNLDWLLKVTNSNTEKISNFINLNTIKYADPILWNITSQYEANTIVVDGQTGNAYISVKPVPSGVSLNREEYWTQIYNYANIVDTLIEQITFNEGDTTTATKPFEVGDLVFINGLLYRVIAPMIAGDSFVIDSNIKKVTMEELLGNLSELVTTNKVSIVNAINEIWNRTITKIGDLAELVTTDKSSVVNAINEIWDRTITKIGDLAELVTTDKSSVVNAINEVNSRITARFVFFCGDSYGYRSGEHVLYPVVCATKMGLGNNYYNGCVARSNFVKTTDGYTKYLAQLQNYNGDKSGVTDIVLCGGTNDLDNTASDNKTALSEFVTYAKTNYPNAKIWIGLLGWNFNNDGGANQASLWSTVRSVYQSASAYGCACILDLNQIIHYKPYISSDGVHPTDEGGYAIGQALASKLLGGDCSDENYGVETGLTFTVNSAIANSANGRMSSFIKNNECVLKFRSFNIVTKSSLELTNTSTYTLGTFDSNYLKGGSGCAAVGVPIYIKTSTGSHNGIGEMMLDNGSLKMVYRGDDISGNITFISIGGEAVYDIIEV